jgi:hypothetical protein
MNDNEMAMATLGGVFLFTLLLIFSSFGFFNMGAYFSRKFTIDKTTIECIEKPQVCKERYEFIKLSEKLGAN